MKRPEPQRALAKEAMQQGSGTPLAGSTPAAAAVSHNMRIPRDFRTLAHEARQAGWHISPLRGGHMIWRAPSGAWVYSSSTPSDWRAPRKLRTDLRRHGLVLTHKR
jgi:hypothetical protein